MSGEAYELLAMLMRYVFVIIGALIVIRAYRWMRRDSKNYQMEMRSLPDAGLVGEIVDLKTGKSQPLPREGTIGSARDCDIRLKYNGVKRHHALFNFEEGKGVRFVFQRRGKVRMDGQLVSAPCYTLHGTQLQIGESIIRIRLFAGLKVPRPVSFMGVGNPGYPVQQMPPPINYPPPYPMEGAYEQPAPEETMGYAGNYTDDGQMTWQFAAYPVEELQQALQQQKQQEEEEEGALYQSPLPQRRRRDRL